MTIAPFLILGKRKKWLEIRKDLSPRAASLLTLASFLTPLALWCIISYTPFLWHPDVKLDIGSSGATVYTAGDQVGKDYYPQLRQEAREANDQLLSASQAGEPVTASSRANIKTLRALGPISVRNGLLHEGQLTSDADIFQLWRQAAEEPAVFRRIPLSEENQEIARQNWTILSDASETYDKATFPKEKLLGLIPQGKPANPVYLPAPHEVLLTGWEQWTRPAEDGKPTMGARLGQSIGIVFGGFLVAALIAVPLGVIAGSFDGISKLFEPFADFFRYMPAPAFATLLVAVLGAHHAPKVALVLIGTFPHLFLMICKTTRLLDRSLLEAAQTLGATRKRLLAKVVVPGILPQLYNDLRIALGWAWTWLVIAELIGVKSGLTEIIDTQGVRRNFDQVYPVIILIGLIGFSTDQLLAWLRPRFFPWVPNARKPSIFTRLLRRAS